MAAAEHGPLYGTGAARYLRAVWRGRLLAERSPMRQVTRKAEQGVAAACVALSLSLTAAQETIVLRAVPTIEDENDPVKLGVGPTNHCAVVYPAEARRRAEAGWVVLRFTVTAEGAVEGIAVTDANPTGVFEEAALAGISRCTFRTRTSDGREIVGEELRVVVRFDPTHE